MISIFIQMLLGWLPASLQTICIFVVEGFMIASMVGFARSLLRLIPVVGKFFG